MSQDELSVEEAAAFAGCSKWAVYKAVERGQLTALAGRTPKVFSFSEVSRWSAARSRPAPDLSIIDLNRRLEFLDVKVMELASDVEDQVARDLKRAQAAERALPTAKTRADLFEAEGRYEELSSRVQHLERSLVAVRYLLMESPAWDEAEARLPDLPPVEGR